MASVHRDSSAAVIAVARSSGHHFSKPVTDVIHVLAGLGVEGDAHSGRTVQHLSRVARDPSQPNLRQVHLIAAELLDELAERGFNVAPGQLGENVTTRGIDLLSLLTGTRLQLGPQAVIEVTGLRNPCGQINGLSPGLLAAVLDRDESGEVIRRAGVMAIVVTGGEVRAGDTIVATPPAPPHVPLGPV